MTKNHPKSSAKPGRGQDPSGRPGNIQLVVSATLQSSWRLTKGSHHPKPWQHAGVTEKKRLVVGLLNKRLKLVQLPNQNKDPARICKVSVLYPSTTPQKNENEPCLALKTLERNQDPTR